MYVSKCDCGATKGADTQATVGLQLAELLEDADPAPHIALSGRSWQAQHTANQARGARKVGNPVDL
jgi:hypothetical protein